MKGASIYFVGVLATGATLLLALTGGCQRTEAEYRDLLLAAAGLKLARGVPTASARWVFEGRIQEASR